MKHDRTASGKRKAVNLTMDTGVVQAAREAGLNLSQICEAALRDAAKKERERQWREDNAEAIGEWNEWVEKNGLPLAEYRMF